MSTWTPLHEDIRHRLSELMQVCGYENSEMSTHHFFDVLYEAIGKVRDDWDATVGESYRTGLCYDINALLTDAIVDVLNENDRSGVA